MEALRGQAGQNPLLTPRGLAARRQFRKFPRENRSRLDPHRPLRLPQRPRRLLLASRFPHLPHEGSHDSIKETSPTLAPEPPGQGSVFAHRRLVIFLLQQTLQHLAAGRGAQVNPRPAILAHHALLELLRRQAIAAVARQLRQPRLVAHPQVLVAAEMIHRLRIVRPQLLHVPARPQHPLLRLPDLQMVGRVAQRARRRGSLARRIPPTREHLRHGQVTQRGVVRGRPRGAARQIQQLVVRHRQPRLRIQRPAHRVILVQVAPRIHFPTSVTPQEAEPRMTPIGSLSGEIQRRNPLRLPGHRREIRLIGADTALHFDIAQPVAAVRPMVDAALRPAMVVVDHFERLVELVSPEAHVLRRPLQFGLRHRCIDDKFELLGREPTQIELQPPRLVGPVKITEPLRHTVIRARHRRRTHLMMRPERRLPLVVNQSVSDHQRTIRRPGRRMRRA